MMRRSSEVEGAEVDLGLKLQNQDRPFLYNHQSSSYRASPVDGGGGGGGGGGGRSGGGGVSSGVSGGGTTSGYSTMSDCIYDVSAANSAGVVRGLQQPFDVSYSSATATASAHPFFKTSGGGMMMGTGTATAAIGFPFTAQQWKELERQAMIYKYMVASLPVPPDLLYSSFSTTFSSSPTSYLLGKYGAGLNVRWVGNSKDAEPGRCKRTDGKKWRCSRDVAPNQKYCERHMHRGRPRSRKPVEQQQQQQQQLLHQQQQQQQQHHTLSAFALNNGSCNNGSTTVKSSSPTKKTRLTESNPLAVGSGFGSVPASKGAGFGHPVMPGGNSYEDSRSLAWTEEQQWQQLVQTNMNSQVFHPHFEEEPLNLNSHTAFNSKSDNIGVLERPLIDAWSMGVAVAKDNHGSNTKSSFTSSNGGHGNGLDEDMCQIQMGLGVIDSSWVGSPTSPGGPLGEVLRPGSIATASDAGEVDFITPPATAVSSPSGVLQKTFASFSDSSGSSSPTCHNSKAKPDVPFHWLN